MGKLGDSRYEMVGYSCVSKPHCKQDDPDAPLMYAIGFALDSHADLDHYLAPVLSPYPSGVLGGGDPGWVWYASSDEGDERRIVVEIDGVVAPPDGIWQEYSTDKVCYEIRAALDNYACMHPERLHDVDSAIRKHGLGGVVTPAGCAPLPKWTGALPLRLICNE